MGHAHIRHAHIRQAVTVGTFDFLIWTDTEYQ